MQTNTITRRIMSVLLTAIMVFGMVILPYDAGSSGTASAATTEGTEIINTDKLTAFSGNTIWTDACEDPSVTSSKLSLVKMYTKIAGSQNYFYLPETANLTALPIFFSGYSTVKIGDYQISSGTCYNFKLKSAKTTLNDAEAYAFPLTVDGVSQGTLTFICSTSPALYFETKQPFPVTVHATNADGVSVANKDDFETKGTFATSEDGKGFQEGKLKKLKGRGNASWTFSYNNFGKYSYNITLDSKTKLFSNLNKGKKFSLLANNGDEAMMRNVFTFSLGEEIGLDFNPSFEYVDVYDNGDYMGSFMITDKVEINSQSVDLSINYDDLNEANNPDADFDSSRVCTNGNLNESSSASKGYKKWVNMVEPTVDEDGNPLPEKITAGDGGFLLEVEYNNRFIDEISGFISSMGQCMVVKYPEYASKNQINFIYDKFVNAESVIYNSNSTYEQINEVIDVESFMKVYLIQELSKNCDSCLSSYYIYYDTEVDNRLHAAPLWDFDMGYGQLNDTRLLGYDASGKEIYAVYKDYDQWQTKLMGISGDKTVKNIQAAIASNTNVWNAIKEYWVAEDGFYNNVINMLTSTDKGKIPYYINEINASAAMNESRWDFILNDVVPAFNDTGETFYETTKFFKEWTTNRLNWMYGSMFDNAAPKMDFNTCVGGAGTVEVTGWAFDPDLSSESIDVKVDINGEAHYVKANLESTDVTEVYGVEGLHRFAATIKTGEAGTNLPVTVSAMNLNSYGVECGYSTSKSKTASVTLSTNAITKVSIGQVSSKGFRIAYKLPDNTIVGKARIAVWTDNNSQDDLKWYDLTINKGWVTCYVNASDHKNETGLYHVHPYVYPASGSGYHVRYTVDLPKTDAPIKRFETEFNGNKYAYYDCNLDWTSAKTFCESIGGHLATITTSDEWQAVLDLMKQNNTLRTWLGAKDIDLVAGGDWEWVTGEKFAFNAWGFDETSLKAQPDCSQGNEFYLGMWSSLSTPHVDSFSWNDFNVAGSSTVYGLLCEFEAHDIIANAANCTTTLPENATLGETVSFTVEANVGYTLGKVTLDGVELTPVDGVYTFTMPNNEVTVDVETTKNVYTITESSSNCVTTLPASATYGDEVSFTVIGNTGYKVDSVAIADTALEAVDGVYTFTMPADDVTVSIQTSKNVYTITESSSNCVTTLPASATYGDEVSFTVTGNTGYKVDSVAIADTALEAVDGVYTFTMPAENVTVSIETSKIDYTISQNGSNFTSTLPASATYEEVVSFTVTGNTGYKVDSVAIADTVLEAVDGVYTFTMPAENVTVSIETSKIDYTISQNGSNFTSTLPTIANHEDVIIFKVEADTDYAVSKVTLNGTELTLANGVYTFTMPAGDVTVDVETYLTVEIGDVNKDGRVNIKDATMIQKYIARLIDFDATQNIVADTNDDGVINVMDATEIQKYIAHIIPEL